MALNRLANIKNPYQTDAKKVLCLCSAGLLRSPTAANALHKEFGYNTRAAGVSKEYALIYADDILLHWADEILCMNDEVAAELDRAIFDKEHLKKKVRVLGISDDYCWGDLELTNNIISQYKNRKQGENDAK